jgi:hypothetical protein
MELAMDCGQCFALRAAPNRQIIRAISLRNKLDQLESLIQELHSRQVTALKTRAFCDAVDALEGDISVPMIRDVLVRVDCMEYADILDDESDPHDLLVAIAESLIPQAFDPEEAERKLESLKQRIRQAATARDTARSRNDDLNPPDCVIRMDAGSLPDMGLISIVPERKPNLEGW